MFIKIVVGRVFLIQRFLAAIFCRFIAIFLFAAAALLRRGNRKQAAQLITFKALIFVALQLTAHIGELFQDFFCHRLKNKAVVIAVVAASVVIGKDDFVHTHTVR